MSAMSMADVRAAAAPESAEDLTLMSFTKAFIAELVSRDLHSIRPHHPGDRRGFTRVVRLLDELVDSSEQSGDRSLSRQLVFIANELRPSNNGAFEGFEAALRAQQLTFARCPNPFYEEIEFPVPKVYAKATVDSLPVSGRELIKKAADSFIEGKGL